MQRGAQDQLQHNEQGQENGFNPQLSIKKSSQSDTFIRSRVQILLLQHKRTSDLTFVSSAYTKAFAETITEM